MKKPRSWIGAFFCEYFLPLRGALLDTASRGWVEYRFVEINWVPLRGTWLDTASR
jgi:hypothetical protein